MKTAYSRADLAKCLREGKTPEIVAKCPSLQQPWQTIVEITNVSLYAEAHCVENEPITLAQSQEQRYGRQFISLLRSNAVTEFLFALEKAEVENADSRPADQA